MRLKYGNCAPWSSGSFTPSNTKIWSPVAVTSWNVGDSGKGIRMQPCEAGASGTLSAPCTAMP